MSSSFTLFPMSLVAEVIEIHARQGAEFVRYADLGRWPGKYPTPGDYRDELDAWRLGGAGRVRILMWRTLRSLASRFLGINIVPAARTGNGTCVPMVLLQHDADADPDRTVRMMRLERDLGVVSSAYFFRRRSIRPEDPDASDYRLDIDALIGLEKDGFEIGYHQNAYELADYDLELAGRVLAEDVDFFRKRFDLRSYVPHGGRPGPRGINNVSMPPLEPLKGLIWAYNGGGARADLTWSDGYVEYEGESGELEDPRAVARRVSGRTRVRYLFHPQYYGDDLRADWSRFSVSKKTWWRRLWNL